MSRLEQELAALPAMSAAQLREKWRDVCDPSSPNVPAPLLRRLIAQRLQERRHGALPALVARELERVAKDGFSSESAPSRIKLTPGTRLVREWNGQVIAVEVLEDGFAYAEKVWRSLSEIARHVTDAHWSGPRFFGLTGRG